MEAATRDGIIIMVILKIIDIIIEIEIIIILTGSQVNIKSVGRAIGQSQRAEGRNRHRILLQARSWWRDFFAT